MERISETLERPETNQARHRLASRALWKWPDRATLEGEIGSLRRGLDAGKKTVVEVDLAASVLCAYYREGFSPLAQRRDQSTYPTRVFLQLTGTRELTVPEGQTHVCCVALALITKTRSRVRNSPP